MIPQGQFSIVNRQTHEALEAFEREDDAHFGLVRLRPRRDHPSQHWTLTADNKLKNISTQTFLRLGHPPNSDHGQATVEGERLGSTFTFPRYPSPDHHFCRVIYVTHNSSRDNKHVLFAEVRGVGLGYVPEGKESQEARNYWYLEPAVTRKPDSQDAQKGQKGEKGEKGDTGKEGPPAPPKKLPAGFYRIRSYDGWSLLTMPTSGELAKNPNGAAVYADSQDPRPGYLEQKWQVTSQNGRYTFRCAGNQQYLGYSGVAVAGTKVVPVSNSVEWEVKDVGGYAWALHLPGGKFSLGVPSMELRHGDTLSLAETDYTPSQMWYIEKYVDIKRERLHPVPSKDLPAGKYKIRSARNDDVYFSTNPSIPIPYLVAGSSSAEPFTLTYTPNSGRCTLMYSGSIPTPQPYYVTKLGTYAGLAPGNAQELVIIEGNGTDYYICFAESTTAPVSRRQVISNELDANGTMFLIQDLGDTPGLGSIGQMWRLEPV